MYKEGVYNFLLFFSTLRNLELLETLQQNIKAIDEHELCGGATGDDKDVGGGNDFSFEMLFDIKCLVQKDDPVLQRFVNP